MVTPLRWRGRSAESTGFSRLRRARLRPPFAVLGMTVVTFTEVGSGYCCLLHPLHGLLPKEQQTMQGGTPMRTFTGRETKGQWRRRLIRVRSNAGVCDHRALVGAGDHMGQCLECGACLATPFTVRTTTCLLVARPLQGARVAENGTRSANRLAMDEVRLPAAVVPVTEALAA
jgi:hypothetical protein